MEEAILDIRFVPNLEDGTVSPSAPQFGGVQGDRNGATVSFFVPFSLRGSRFRYRIEGEDGAGSFVSTEPLPLDDEGYVTALLDERFTAAGGQILVRLVVSEVQDDNEITVVRSFDGRLFFADAPTPGTDSPFRDTLSAMVVRADEKLNAMEEMADDLAEQVSGLNARVGANEGMVLCHGTRLTAAETAITAAESRLTADEQTAEELDGWVQRIYDNLENLEGLAERKESEPTPWQLIQKIVRAGLAKKLFSVGDVLVSEHDEYGPIAWEIIGFDHDFNDDERFAHSMTLQAKNCLHLTSGLYDLKEYSAPEEGYSNGRADWELSAIYKWLNSGEEGDHWFSGNAPDPTDPSYASQDGFMRGMSQSFLSAIGTVKLPIGLNNTYSTHSDTMYAKFFLPSRAEVFGGRMPAGVTVEEGTAYEKYGEENSSLSSSGGGADSNRVKTLDGTACDWLIRSVNPMQNYSVYYVSASGAIVAQTANAKCGVAPVCCIL